MAAPAQTEPKSVLLQDYLIAEGYNGATARGDVVTFESKYYCSQDGTRCAQLLAAAVHSAHALSESAHSPLLHSAMNKWVPPGVLLLACRLKQHTDTYTANSSSS